MKKLVIRDPAMEINIPEKGAVGEKKSQALTLPRITADTGELFDRRNMPRCSLTSVPAANLPEKFESRIDGFINWPKNYQPPKASPYGNDEKYRIIAVGIFYLKVPSSIGEGGGFRCIGKFVLDKSLNPLDGIWEARRKALSTPSSVT